MTTIKHGCHYTQRPRNDSMKSKTYTIPINPITWKRAGVNNSMFYDKQKQEKLAVGLYLINQHEDTPRFSGPLKMTVTFFMKQPKTIKERNIGGSKYCYKTPDLDNLCKFLMDAINDTDVVWEDDKLVSHLIAQKIYDAIPRTVITIEEIK